MKIHVLPYYLCLIFGLNLLNQTEEVNTNYVLFENVGQMASSVSYLHVKLTLNLSAIEHQISKYISLLHIFNATLIPTINETDPVVYYKFYYEKQLQWLYERHTNTSRKIIGLHIQEAGELKQKLASLRHVLPLPSDGEEYYQPPRRYRGPRTSNHSEAPTNQPNDSKSKRATNGATFLGIVGTFLGIYNTVQIQYLWQELSETKAGLSKLIEVQLQQFEQLKDIDLTFQVLFRVMSLQAMQDPGLLEARLNRFHDQINERIQIAQNIIQQAQHRRLSVEFLTQAQLTTLFSKLINTAERHGCQLLLDHQSDLFQVETSYFFDSQNVHLLVHVPMVPPSSMLRLFKLHPFPIPLQGGHYMIPQADNDILAITIGNQRYSTQLSSSDLLGCVVLNRVYLCESNGVLRKNFSDTCLGALYQQDMVAVNKLCTLRVCENVEVIRQLLGNWFAVFTPRAYTVPVECKNGTSKEIMISGGVSKFHLSPGCEAHFHNHLVLSDYSIREPADFIEYNWNFDLISIPQEVMHPEQFLPALDQLKKFGINDPSIRDLREFYMDLQRGPGWWAHFVHFAGNILLVLLIAGIILVGGIRFHRFLEQKRRQLRATLQPIQPLDQELNELNVKFIPKCG